MKKSFLMAACAAAMWGVCALAPANAQAVYIQGGPSQHDGVCQVATDGFGMYGYTMPCPRPVVKIRHVKKTKS